MRSWSRVAVLLAAVSLLPFGSGAVTDTETSAHIGEITHRGPTSSSFVICW